MQKKVLLNSQDPSFQWALKKLVRREYSRFEMQQLLKKKFPEVDANIILDLLIHNNYLNETRFIEMLVRSRISRGYGPFYIQQELKIKHHINQIDCVNQQNWHAILQQQIQKRFGDDFDKIKAKHYFSRKGFPLDLIDEVIL